MCGYLESTPSVGRVRTSKSELGVAATENRPILVGLRGFRSALTAGVIPATVATVLVSLLLGVSAVTFTVRSLPMMHQAKINELSVQHSQATFWAAGAESFVAALT